MLFLSFVFFLSAFIISSAVKNYYTPQKVTERLTSEISGALVDLETEINKVAKKNAEDVVSFQDFLEENYKNAFAEKGIEILIYKRDSLKFWTANVFAAPLSIDSENFASEVVKSGSGYYLAKQLRSKNFVIIGLQLIRYNYKFSNDYLPSGFYKRFSAPNNAALELRSGEYNINGPSGKFLFCVKYDQPFELALWLQYLVFTLYITSFLWLIAAV